MAKLVYALNQSLDGYIDHDAPGMVPTPALFRHFTDEVRELAGSLYGRTMYETMRYWDTDQDNWGEAEWDYAAAWRAQPKWVVSSTLASVGPNATLIRGDVEAAARKLKAEVDGQIEVAGPTLAASLAGLIDEYQTLFAPGGDGRRQALLHVRAAAADAGGHRAIRRRRHPAHL